jgi:hypothetical protein
LILLLAVLSVLLLTVDFFANRTKERSVSLQGLNRDI